VSGTGPAFDLSGGALCLDFTNTLAGRPRKPRDDVRDYGDFLEFGRQAIDLEEVTRLGLVRAAQRRPALARAALRRAVALRESLYAIFSSVAGGREPPIEDLEVLNKTLRRALAHLVVTRTPGGFAWDWSGGGEGLDRVLWPVSRSAADLLTSDDRERVRECASETCRWLFLDRSPSRRRRWCDMKVCGNRAKARRHYHRTKDLKEGTDVHAGRAAGSP